MSKELRFDGKVVVVTGAGGGLGRSHALLFASRGAKVVVNDLGGGFTGEGGASQKAADKVVDEIKAAGGQAAANYDSVENGDAIVKTAIDAFGRIDILINNAGILRDVSFQKMTQQDWDLIYKVHVLGSFKVTYAAWPYMRDQGFGRIVMTASAAGIYGNFGQANYSMAKLGLVGFANTLAIEGRKRNILVNTIAPIAGSRMTETVLPPNLIEALKPEYVSPLVARLCHESSEETGGLFEVGGGFVGKLRWERSTGKLFRLGRPITMEMVDDAWKDITQFDKTTHPADITSSMAPIMENVEAGPSKGGNEFIDVDAALGWKFPEMTSSYDERDLSIYALGVGAASNPSDDRDLQLVYEMHGKGMKALPTYGVIPALNVIMSMGKEGKTAPGLKYGLDRVLHGEQYTELKRPLPTKAKLTHKGRIKDIFDKGKNALVVTEIVSYDEDGMELVKNEVTTFVRGAGGWGGDRGPSADINVPPERAPDKVVEEKIPAHQALLYRLSGDWNPLHADPGFAKAFGFERPILHGLCSFGYAGRHVVQAFAPDGNPDWFKSIRVRFAKTVLPGDTLVTEMWKEDGGKKVVFRCKVKERDEVCISNAAIEFWSEIPKKAAKPAATAAAGGGKPAAMPISTDIFKAIGTFVAKNPEVAEKAKTCFQFKLSAPESVWTIDLKGSPPSVVQGAGAAPQCTLEMSDADFMDMATGKADAMKLFSTQRLKISGDVMASQKLGFLKKLTPEMVLAEMNARVGAGGGGGAAAAAGGAPEGFVPRASDVFVAIKDHVERNPDIVGSIGYVFKFKVKDPDSNWVVDLKNGKGSVSEADGAADCTLEISQADLLDMTAGKADAMKLFTTGKLKISGNVMASQKLEFLKKMDPEKAKAAVLKARGAEGASGAGGAAKPAAATAAPAAAKAAQAPAIFAALGKRLAENKALEAELGGVVVFKITGPDAAWTVGGGGVKEGAAAGAKTTLTIADADLVALAKGTSTAKDLYQHGKLRVDGDVGVAHRLGLLKGLA